MNKRLRSRIVLAGSVAVSTAILSLTLVRDETAEDALLLVSGAGIAASVLGWLAERRRAPRELLARHFELSLDLFGTANFDGYFEELNPAWERALGYSKEELRARPFIEFVHPEDRPQTLSELERLVGGGETVRFRNRYEHATGSHRWLEWNARADLAEKKVYAAARDITPQVEAELALNSRSAHLEETVRARTRDLEESRLEVLQRLAITAEYRDDDTHEHTERVGRTAARIARQLGLSSDDVDLIRRAAPLHDIGKVGVPDAVLRKRGKLSPEEFELMKQHVEVGARILAQGKFPVLHVARTIALTHHERWDGSGYLYGLSGESIPLVGRITAVADVFDALTHARPYKPAWPLESAIAEIRRGAGAHFDPEVVEAFLGLDHARLLHPVRGVRPRPPKVRYVPSEKPPQPTRREGVR